MDGHALDVRGRDFVATRRTATLVTVSERGMPRPVPICFVLGEPAGDERGEGGAILYTPLDEKPKRSADVRALARVRDILARPGVTLLFDRWSEDWSKLAWLRAHGRASLLEPQADPGAHGWAVAALRQKYPQYRAQGVDELPLIRISIEQTVAWAASAELGW